MAHIGDAVCSELFRTLISEPNRQLAGRLELTLRARVSATSALTSTGAACLRAWCLYRWVAANHSTRLIPHVCENDQFAIAAIEDKDTKLRTSRQRPRSGRAARTGSAA